MFQRSWTPTAVACAALLAATIYFPISSSARPEFPNDITLTGSVDPWIEQSTGPGLIVVTDISDWGVGASSAAWIPIGLDIVVQGSEWENYLLEPGFAYSVTILGVTTLDVGAWSYPSSVGHPCAFQWRFFKMKPAEAEDQAEALGNPHKIPTCVTDLSLYPGPAVSPCRNSPKQRDGKRCFPRPQVEVFFLSEYSQIKWDNKGRLFQNCMSVQVGSAEFPSSDHAWWPPCWKIGNNAFLRSSGFSGWGCVVFAKRRDGLGSQSTSTYT